MEEKTNTTTEPADPRSQRGLVLARNKKDAIKPLVGSKVIVPSGSDNGSSYVVDTKAETCSCLDWSKLGGHDRPHRCKHIWAAFHVLKLADGSELLVDEPPNKYPRDWKATNACRTQIPRLGPQLSEELVDSLGLTGRVAGLRGRPGVPRRDLVLTALLRAYEQLTAGAAVVRAQELCEMGRIRMTHVPHYNTLLREFAAPDLMPTYHRALALSALPMIGMGTTFAVDGTGFGSSVFDCHYTHKHGPKKLRRLPTKKHRWIGAKLVYNVDTLVIAAVQVTEAGASECRLMPELLRRAVANGACIETWCGDAAYMADYNVVAVEQVGGRPYFDWPRGVTGKTKPAIARLYKTFDADQDLYWASYGRRSLAEAGMHSIKTRFGHSLQSRVPAAQYAELMLRCIAHNIAMLVMAVEKFDVPQRYWVPDPEELPEFGTTTPPRIQAKERK